MFDSKAKKAAKLQLKIEAEKARLKAQQEARQERQREAYAKSKEQMDQAGELLKNWVKSNKKASAIIAGIVMIASLSYCSSISGQVAEKAAAEEKARIEWEAGAEEREKAAEEARIAEEIKQEKAAASASAKFKETYGVESLEEFVTTCRLMIIDHSGSSNFGYFNSELNEYESLGSLVLQKSVHGKNAFGVDIEQQYKCWTMNGEIEIEHLGTKFN